MTVELIYMSKENPAPWQTAMANALPDARFHVWGEEGLDFAAMDYALAWRPEPGALAKFPNLKAIFNLGAGVDALLKDQSLPKHIPIVRLVDPRLTSGMTEYVVHWVLHFHRDFHVYARQQKDAAWVQRPAPVTAKRRVGILGLGALGRDCARTLQALGFKAIAGWSRTAKIVEGVESFAGADALDAFLAQSEILISLLPHTKDTEGLVNADRLAKLPEGACVINAGRGQVIDDQALLAALDSERVAGAALDVFAQEPLPKDHPYWSHAKVSVTPHIASITIPDAAAPVIADGIRILEEGGWPDNIVDLKAGY